MTDEETRELDDLKARCLKKNGEPRKDAETADLERLKELCEKEGMTEPLSPDEKEELDALEKRARSGRRVHQPSPVEMVRLGKLRKRE